MKRTAGPILRRVGLVIEMASLLALVTWGQGEATPLIAGITGRHLLMAGVTLGFVLWGVGLTLLLRAGRRSRSL